MQSIENTAGTSAVCRAWNNVQSPAVKYAECNVQCAECSVQCAEFSVQCAVCSVQCAECSVQCAVCSVQYVVYSVQCPVVQCAAGLSLAQKFSTSWRIRHFC